MKNSFLIFHLLLEFFVYVCTNDSDSSEGVNHWTLECRLT